MNRVVAVIAAVALALLGLVTPAQAANENPRAGWVPNGPVYAIATAGDRVYLGGKFTSLKNPATGKVVKRTRLAALDRTTGELVTDWAPAVDNNVRSIAVSADGQTVYAGGAFLSANGTSVQRVAAFDHGGALVSSFRTTANKEVRSLLLRDGFLYVGGMFGQVNGKPRTGLGRVDATTGALDTTWVANVGGGRVFTLDAPDGGAELVVGGSFTSLDGAPRSFLGSVDFSTSQVSGWEPTPICDACFILDVDREAEATYVAMSGPGGRVAAFPNTSGPRMWAVWGDGDVQAVAARSGVVYAGGHFGPDFGSVVRYQLAAVEAGDGSPTDFVPVMNGSPTPGVWALSADDDYLRVGGAFQSVGSTSQARYAEFSY